MDRYKNVDNIVHRNVPRSGGRYFATRLRTTRAIRTQLLFHPIVWIFFVVSFSRLLRYSCSLALNVPVFHSFCILSAILVREHLFDSFLAQWHSYTLSLLNPVSGVKFDGLEKWFPRHVVLRRYFCPPSASAHFWRRKFSSPAASRILR